MTTTRGDAIFITFSTSENIDFLLRIWALFSHLLALACHIIFHHRAVCLILYVFAAVNLKSWMDQIWCKHVTWSMSFSFNKRNKFKSIRVNFVGVSFMWGGIMNYFLILQSNWIPFFNEELSMQVFLPALTKSFNLSEHMDIRHCTAHVLYQVGSCICTDQLDLRTILLSHILSWE